ncbi:MAG: TauD/TfdA family dioxygenase [Rhodomicrobium sp.]|nr:TauD/TfdA family dioxygenase [Rhodomicrobium sp.]
METKSGQERRLWPDTGPFCLEDVDSYTSWRAAKLARYPKAAGELRVAIRDLASPSAAERAHILDLCGRANMAIYDSGPQGMDPVQVRPALRALADSLRLREMEDHRSGEADGVVAIEVTETGGRAGYIPYSNRPISWHTDGYYNYHGPSHCVHAMLLHCVRDAAEGGVNALLDHEIAYIRLRDRDPAFIAALMHPEAMTIPEGEEAQGHYRPDNTGPVFFIDPVRNVLAMRYTARKRHVSWREDVTTRRALAALEEVLESEPLILTHKLRPGEGLICNNVLHNRSGFKNEDAGGPGRLLYRVRYHDRLSL